MSLTRTLSAEEQTRWIPSKNRIGDYGKVTFSKVAKIHKTELNEHMATVRVSNSEKGKKLLAILETGTEWGYRILQEVKTSRGSLTVRVICVGSYYSKKKRKRYLVFRIINPNEKEMANAENTR